MEKQEEEIIRAVKKQIEKSKKLMESDETKNNHDLAVSMSIIIPDGVNEDRLIEKLRKSGYLPRIRRDSLGSALEVYSRGGA